MKTIFVVDDNATNLVTARQALEGHYKVAPLPSAARMFEMAKKITPDLILLDIAMPEMDGFEALQLLKKDARLRPVPVVFLTSKNDAETEIRGFELGALDFITKPFSPPVLVKRIESHIETDKLVKKGQNVVRRIHNSTIKIIADMVDHRDKVTGWHIERTQKYVELLINALSQTGVYAAEIANWDINLLLPSAQLHDVGKIAVSDIILNKPGKLTDEEFGIMQTHCAVGERMIDDIAAEVEDDGFLHHAKLFAGYHHERWNGKGYPRELAGQDIPLEGRIMAVADVYDALVSERPYKKPFTHEQAVEVIEANSGSHFDPKIVKVFMTITDKFEAVLKENTR
jgi:putative two-component system response regulator